MPNFIVRGGRLVIETPPRNGLIKHVYERNSDREMLRELLQRVQAAQTAGA